MRIEKVTEHIHIMPFFVLFYAIIIAGTLLFTGSCKNRTEQPSQKPVITVSVLPQKYFVEKIAGNQYEIQVMIPSTGSCETYEPEPKQLENLLSSKVYFTIGYIHFESTWVDKFKSTAPDLIIADMSKGIEIHSDHADHEEPHLWLSPKSAGILAGNILSELLRFDPGNEDFFKANYNAFLAELDSIDLDITRMLEPISNRTFMIYHPALMQFANDYGFTQIPVEYEGKSPSPLALEKLIIKAKDEKIGLIFVQEQFELENARLIAKETGAALVSINPMDYDWKKQMYLIAESLRKYCK